MSKKIYFTLALILSVSFLYSQVTVTGSTGANSTYSTLKLAFTAINGTAQTGNDINITITSNTTETSTATLNAGLWNSITIYPNFSGLTIGGSIAGPLISLNGADNVTIDGRPNKSGSTRSLILVNSNTGSSASTVYFANSAESNTVKYCTIKGEESSTSKGVIFFGTATAGNGNDNNTIDNNSITNAGVGRPVNAIFSQGSTGFENSGNIISNNDIFDFLKQGAASNGIHINTFSTAFTITGNSFYETTSFVPTSTGAYSAISLKNTSGTDFIVSDNFIGGSAAACGGTAWSKSDANNNAFFGININVGASGFTNVQNNTIKNINWANSTNGSLTAINAITGAINIGTVIGNKIGETTGNGSIILSDSTSGASLYGINIQSANTVNCKNNTVGSLTGINLPAFATNIYGINKNATTGATVISDNFIGSSTTSNSIQATSQSTASAQVVIGINNSSPSGTDGMKIDNNTVANLTNFTSNSNTATAGRVSGIASLAGTDTITNNVIRDLSNANLNTATSQNASVVGLALSGTTPKIITNNTIYNLTNSNSVFAGRVYGVYFAGSTSGNIVSGNLVHNLSVNSASVGATIVGIRINGGTTSFSNNIILLSSNTTTVLTGIWETGSSGNNNNLYFNTVCISGSPTTGSANSQALSTTSTANLRVFKNNLLVNVRSNDGTASGSHYAINISSKTGLTTNYNNYYVSGNGTVLGYLSGNRTTLAALKTATAQDANSLNTDPSFVNSNGIAATDFKVTQNLVGTSGAGIPITDYGLNSRTIPTIGAWELLLNVWKGSVSSNWSTAGNWLSNAVPLAGESVIFDASPANHCALDADCSVKDITNAQSTYKLQTNSHKLTISGNLNFTGSAQIDASSSSSTVEFAGTTQQTIPSGAFVNNTINNLILNNSANVVLNGSLTLANSFTATNGALDVFTNSTSLTLSGTSAQDIVSNSYLSNKLYNLTVDNSAGITINADTLLVANNLTINSGKKLTISAAKQLNVLGSITNSADADGLVVKSSSSSANGTLIFHNVYASPVMATVEMYSKAAAATYNAGVYSNYKWQYFGIPMRTLNVNPFFNGSFVRRWNEPTSKWISLQNGDAINPFVGHEVTQVTAKTFMFEGQLENSTLSTTLTPTAGSTAVGQFLFANPYTAAIDIKKINFGAQVYATIYLYNAGSYADWSGTSGLGNNPGQYLSIPQNLAGIPGIPDQIPSMQGFFVLDSNLPGDHTFEIPYSSVAIKNTSQLRVPSATKTLSQMPTVIIDVKGSRFSDKMWIFTNNACTQSYDNGWDGIKFLGSVLAPQLYTMGLDGDFQTSTVNDINNTIIGFKAGEDTNYSITFTNSGMSSVYDKIYLVDVIENKVTDVTQNGSVYSFVSQPTPTPVSRFRIITNNTNYTETPIVNNATDMTVFSSEKTIFVNNTTSFGGELKVFCNSGVLLKTFPFSANAISILPTTLPVGVYVVQLKTAQTEITKKVVLR